jgi:hypothetical protein
MCSWRVTDLWWRNSKVVRAYNRLWLRRDATLVTTSHVLAALSIFPPIWLRIMVCYVGCVCCCSGVYSCDGVCFDPYVL